MDVADFLERHPEFDAVPYERVAIAIEDAVTRVTPTKWTVDVSKQATAALAAHILSTRFEEITRVTGLATTLQNGGSYSPTQITDDLMSTHHGARYYWLLTNYGIGTGFPL